MRISDEDKVFVKDDRSKAEATNSQRTFGRFFAYSDRVILALQIGSSNLINNAKRQLSQFLYNQAARSLFTKTLIKPELPCHFGSLQIPPWMVHNCMLLSMKPNIADIFGIDPT